MIIDCPSCASAYHIARVQLGAAGRKLRCAQCRTVWFAATGDGAKDSTPEIVGEAVSERSAPPSYDEIYGQARPDAPARPTGRAWRLPLPSLGFVACVALMSAGMGAVAWRAAVVRWAPPAARLYAAIGLPVNLRGLDLRHVTSTLLGDPGAQVLAVEGEIVNVAPAETSIPNLRLMVRGRDQSNLYVWTSAPPKSKLSKGEAVPFRARLAAPPESASEVVVPFEALGARVREARK